MFADFGEVGFVFRIGQYVGNQVCQYARVGFVKAACGHVESTVKIAQAGLPIVYAIIGGNPRYFKKLIQAYREIGSESGHADKDLKVGAHSWGWIAEDGEQAVKDYFNPTKQVVDATPKPPEEIMKEALIVSALESAEKAVAFKSLA